MFLNRNYHKFLQAIFISGTVVILSLFVVTSPFLTHQKKSTDTTLSITEELKKQYRFFDFSLEKDFYNEVVIEKMLQIPQDFFNNTSYDIISGIDSISIKTDEYEVGTKTVHIESTRTIKGSKYKVDKQPLDIAIYVKEKVNPELTLDDHLKTSEKYFSFPSPSSSQKKSTFNAEVDGRVVELIWNTQNTLESRAVWSTEASDGTVYFIACRVFKDSPLYKKNTCFYQEQDMLHQFDRSSF